ncbi:U32 family peptidase [Vallitalea sp.]|jgi:collagenase-like PrtC family protease|uniref:U32 family peptidase n=1 Tax=Vallitalea sp. TaxID=1882829 RepID=UPI0025EBB582|nr:U32 family peptidase [Vallitalea sp.]MCT4688865.1 U32 family peptidase [Vallitalea sp.]
MFLNIPTNWDNEILNTVEKINSSSQFNYKVGQIYGSSLNDIGSGRLDTPMVEDIVLKDHINKCHELGVMFNFVINSPSLGGIEHDQVHREKILDVIRWISDLGADIVTVSIPFLGELINHHFPHLKVKMSTILDVRNVQGIRLLDQLGPNIHSITLSRFINREMQLLKNIVHEIDFEVELLANSFCLHNCPYQKYHADLVCWQAKTDKNWKEPFQDYRALGCDGIRFRDPSELIKSPWIRPEDLIIYENLGIHSIKIAGRTFPTQWIVKIIKAYAKGSYDGNLWELIMPFHPVYVDNKLLDGFIDYFSRKKFDCGVNCGTCTYCNEVADKVVTFNEEKEEYLEDLDKRLEGRIDRELQVQPYLAQSRI